MSGAVEPLQRSAGDARREQLGVAGIDDVVGLPMQDERRRRDLPQPRERVVRGARRRQRLPAGGIRRMRGAIGADLVDERTGRPGSERVDDKAPLRLARVEPRRLQHQRHRLGRHRRRVGTARGRAAQNEPLDTLRRCERELLRDHPSEARSDDVRALEVGRVEDAERVRRELRRRVRARRLVTVAEAPVVERDDRERIREALRCRAPAAAAVAEPLHEQHGPPVAVHVVRDPHVGDLTHTPSCAAGPGRTASSRRRKPRGRPRAAIPASPPGRKKTIRMKITPSRNSGCESGVFSTEGSP